ncbi:MAG: reverse transcriptase domain-containing protein [Acidiferrobacteraceae bacterium]
MANVYLHYAFDAWVQQWRRRYARGTVVVVRYADDIVMGFQHQTDAIRFHQEVQGRLQRFGLTLHPDKTRLVRFGRFAPAQNRKQGLGKPETFDFLGFTHFCGVSRQGRFLIHRKTRRDRLHGKLKAISRELKVRLHQPVRTVGMWLRTVVQGHLNYYSVPLNGAAISRFCYEVRSRWYRALCRRSQRKRLNWKSFGPIADRWIPKATIVHPYPHQRFDATHSR